MYKLASCAILAASVAWAQNTHPPVIDIHVHTLGGFPGVPPMCPFNPQFLASDPHGTEGPTGWAKQDCTESLEASKTPGEYMKAVIAEWERLNAKKPLTLKELLLSNKHTRGDIKLPPRAIGF